MEKQPQVTFPADPRDNLKIRLGKAIQNRRYELRISQEELGARACLHRTYISDIERGARNPSLDSIEKVARALGIPLAQLFERASAQAARDTGAFPPAGNHTANATSQPQRPA